MTCCCGDGLYHLDLQWIVEISQYSENSSFLSYLILQILCDVSPGFKARVRNLFHTWWRHMYYMFPEIHPWCDTCWPTGSHYGCWADLFHIHATRHNSRDIRSCGGNTGVQSRPVRRGAGDHTYCSTLFTALSQG